MHFRLRPTRRQDNSGVAAGIGTRKPPYDRPQRGRTDSNPLTGAAEILAGFKGATTGEGAVRSAELAYLASRGTPFTLRLMLLRIRRSIRGTPT